MGATGESVRRLTDHGFDPAWSPDGTRVVFASEGVFNPLSRDQDSELWVADVGSGETHKLYDDGDAVQPAWSPGGDRIALWSAGDTGQRDIFTLRADGTDPVDVTRDIDVDWNPVWSADGRHLYFASDRGGSMNLWRVAIDEATGRVLGEPEAVPTPARWSSPLALSGGGRVAFVASERRSNLSRMPFDPVAGEVTGPPQAITRGTLPVWHYKVSPDGEWVAFCSGREVQEDLYLVRTDGSGMRKLTDDRHRDRGPSWSPDGQRILFYSNRSGRYNLWSIQRDGGGLRQLSRIERRSLWFPNISPDGKQLSVFNKVGTQMFEPDEEDLLEDDDATVLPPVGEAEAVFQGWNWSSNSRYLAGRLLGSPGVAIFDFEKGDYRLFDTPGGGAGVDRGWLADGRALVESEDDLYILDLDSGSFTPVPEPPYPLEDADARVVSPDGRWLYFTVG